MRYALLIHYPQPAVPSVSQDEIEAGKAAFSAYAKALEDAGVLQSAEVLQTIANATSVSLKQGKLQVQVLDRGTAWLDTGTFESMMQASEYVRVIEDRQGFKIGCIEEIAWRAGWIDDARLQALAEPLVKSGYGAYLRSLLEAAD